MLAPAASLFDQTALTDRAERLVKAALAGGADAADAVALRSLSLSIEVRDGAVEESESAEGDDLGLRVLVGRRQAVVSTNDLTGDGSAALAERAVAMARVAPEDKYAGLADASLLARDFPDLDLIDRALPTVQQLEAMARAAEQAGLAVKGVTKSGGASASAGIGGMVLVTSHGFRGAYLGSRHGLSMTAIAGEGTGMERDYDFSSALHASDLEAPEKIGRSAGERAVARLNPRKVVDPQGAGGVRSAHRRLAGRPSRQRHQRRLGRAQDQLPEGQARRAGCSPTASTSSTIRCASAACARARSTPRAWPGASWRWSRTACCRTWMLDSATARELGLTTTGHAQRGVSSTPSPGATNLHLEAGQLTPEELIADIADGFYVTDLIGMGVNMVTGDYSRGASGFWIENGQRTYPVSEVTIAGHLIDIFRTLTPANDLEFRYGTNAPTVRLEGLTVAGQ